MEGKEKKKVGEQRKTYSAEAAFSLALFTLQDMNMGILRLLANTGDMFSSTERHQGTVDIQEELSYAITELEEVSLPEHLGWVTVNLDTGRHAPRRRRLKNVLNLLEAVREEIVQSEPSQSAAVSYGDLRARSLIETVISNLEKIQFPRTGA